MKNIFGATDKGLARATNQDAFAVESVSGTLQFAVLCDGMGGETGGNIASSIAVKHAVSSLKRNLAGELHESSLRSILLSVISGANALVYEAAQKDRKLAGMGTTMILAVILNECLYLACVGDSRAYCASAERELQVSRDHTMVQELVDIGKITREEARVHPERHIITRAVGVETSVNADFFVQELAEGDIVLLCSDGLYNYLRPGMMHGLLKDCMERRSAKPLIELAKSGGGSDNITAVVCG